MSFIDLSQEWIRGAWRDPVQFFQVRKKRLCPCCDYTGAFVSAKKRGSREFRCPNCKSRPRDRQIGLILSRSGLDFKDKAILHFAPEWWLFLRLRHMNNYVGGDIISRRNANAKVDITNIQYPDDCFDFIICNHVLEHVPDETSAIQECVRTLKPSGIAIFTIPIVNWREKTWEPPSSMSKVEIEKICGWDHKRLYGMDVAARFEQFGLATRICRFGDKDTEACRLFDEPVFLCSKDRSIVDKIGAKINPPDRVS